MLPHKLLRPFSTLTQSGGGGKGLNLAVGLSLGLSVGLLGSNLQRILQPEPTPPPISPPGIDPKTIEQLISQDREINQLKHLLNGIKEEIRERNRAPVAPQQILPQKGNVDVIELSQVIEANNLANANHYKKQLEEQRKALLREHMLKLEGEILKVRNKYKPILNKVKELETHFENLNQVAKMEGPARILWVSCQALLNKLKHGPQEPLEKEPAYEVLKEYAAKNNRLAQSVVDSIPVNALKQGVQSEDTLVNRFSKIEKICKRVALVGERGNLGNYLISYLQSLLIFDNIEVPEDEVSGRKLVDPTSWSTFDIITRVKYCLSVRNLEQAIRYANQLKGQARVVALDWIRDARTHLEARQALSILSTHAESVAVDAARQSYVE